MHFTASEVARLANCLAEPWSGYVRSLGTVATGEGFDPKDSTAACKSLFGLRMALLDVHLTVNQWEDDDS